MERRFFVVLAIIIMLSLVACGGYDEDPTVETNTVPVMEQTTAPTTAVTTAPTTEAVTVATTEPTTEPTEHIHNYIATVTDPTCTEAGYTTHSCSCGDSYTDTPVDALGHSYESKTVEATCTERGYTKHTCSCGDTYKDNYVKALGHKWGEWETTQEPTLSATGKAERKCDVCGNKETKTLPKEIADHTHKYEASVTQEATCSEDGVKTFTCSCGDSYTEKIGKLDHKYESKVTNATCTAQGYTTYTCGNCGDTYKSDYTDMKDHSYTAAVTTEPNCYNTGVRTYSCACGKSYTETIEKTEHNYEDTVVKPTCTAGGYTEHKCSICGDTFKDSEKEALGHKYSSKVIAPTCTEKGYTKHTCSNCDDSYTDSETEPTGHLNVKTEKTDATCMTTGYIKEICQDCGAVIKEETIPVGACSYSSTMRMNKVAKNLADQGDYDYAEYVNFNDWNVNVCPGCGYPDMETLKFAYSDSKAASIMLGYVNSLRESVHGTNEYNLELDSTLIELAKIRAKEISVNFSHGGGTYTNAGENISVGGPNIYDHYVSWCNSSGHYRNMIKTEYKYFGYALYKSTDCWSTAGIYGVQLFWTPDSKDMYGG